MKSFSEFSERKINESEPIIFKGIGGDPYQYKIEGDKVYYSKKSEGTLDATSDKWIEQTREKGIDAIKNLYSKILSSNLTIDEETKAKIIELQEILNKAKPAIPKLWTLPLSVDGNPGWRTAWSWYMIMIIYPQMDNINDISFYSKESFQGFKNPANWGDSEINSGLDFFQKFIMDSRWTKEGKIDFDMILEDTKKTVDFMIGKLEPGSSVSYLYCNSTTKSIPESITAEMVIVESNCPLKTLPASTTCKSLNVTSDNASNQFKIPVLKTNSVAITGPVTMSPELKQIDYLLIIDNIDSGSPANKNPIPEFLKNIGSLYINSESITDIPNGLKIGEIMENYTADPIIPDVIINSIPFEEEKLKTKKKKPWLKRIFSKEKYYYESEDYSIYEGFSGDPGNLSIEGCINIKTLPTGLVVLGDFNIQGSGIEFQFTDDQIKQACQITGKIVRTPGEEDILEQ